MRRDAFPPEPAEASALLARAEAALSHATDAKARNAAEIVKIESISSNIEGGTNNVHIIQVDGSITNAAGWRAGVVAAELASHDVRSAISEETA